MVDRCSIDEGEGVAEISAGVISVAYPLTENFMYSNDLQIRPTYLKESTIHRPILQEKSVGMSQFDLGSVWWTGSD